MSSWENVLLIEDTRQQIYGGNDKHANIHTYCEKIGLPVVRQVLNYGDYALCNKSNFDPWAKQDYKTGEFIGVFNPDMKVVVDTKQSVMELFSNLTHEHRRFRDECIRSQDAGSQLIILIEETLPEGNLEKWEAPVWRTTSRYHTAGQKMTLADPVRLRKMMYTMQAKYGVKFRFCDPRQTGKHLIEYLTGVRN